MLGNEAAVLLQLREDVTRYRYGDEQHLDESLTKIFMFNRVRTVMAVMKSVGWSLHIAPKGKKIQAAASSLCQPHSIARKKSKEKLTLFSNYNGSLLREHYSIAMCMCSCGFVDQPSISV